MLSASEAERLIFTLVMPIMSVETVHLERPTAAVECIGRVLAASVTSELDFPHWDNSAMDGYALRARDVQTVPATLQVIEEIPAGKVPQKTVEPGQAARILTGAMMPAGADTVVMQENTTRQGEEVTMLQVPQQGAFVRQRGSFSEAGAEVLGGGRGERGAGGGEPHFFLEMRRENSLQICFLPFSCITCITKLPAYSRGN